MLKECYWLLVKAFSHSPQFWRGEEKFCCCADKIYPVSSWFISYCYSKTNLNIFLSFHSYVTSMHKKLWTVRPSFHTPLLEFSFRCCLSLEITIAYICFLNQSCVFVEPCISISLNFDVDLCRCVCFKEKHCDTVVLCWGRNSSSNCTNEKIRQEKKICWSSCTSKLQKIKLLIILMLFNEWKLIRSLLGTESYPNMLFKINIWMLKMLLLTNNTFD